MILHCPTAAKSSFVTRSRLYFETTVILSLNSENNGRILKMIKTLVKFGNHDFEIIYETEVISYLSVPVDIFHKQIVAIERRLTMRMMYCR